MRYLVLAVLLVAFLAVPVMAEETSRGIYSSQYLKLDDWLNNNDEISHKHTYTDNYTEDARIILGVKFDAPNLIKFSEYWYLGLEGGKDMYTNLFMDTAAWVEDDLGYFGYIKLTYLGTLLDFSR